ncbi:MAG: ABC transporter ATP-binding protein [Deltaproteobacteria bacterium]|nr:ABC transporter ATP-binding protein [Deltaproteobacteria bacterium]
MKQPVLEAEQLYYQYQSGFELNTAGIQLFPGEILGIMGPNGCGKSTLVRVLSLLLKPERGKITVAGTPIETNKHRFSARRKCSVVFQEPLLFNRSVSDNLALPLKFRKHPPSVINRKVEKWLNILGVSRLAHRPARTLSGGEARRVCLARAMVTEPKLLFMDEPFSDLDQPAKEALMHDLALIVRRAGTAVMIVTHDREEAAVFSDRLGVMQQGSIVQFGTPARIFNQPATPFVADFVGVENIFSGESDPDSDFENISINGTKITVPTEIAGPVHVIIRPEDILLSTNKISSSARNQFYGKIIKIVPRERTYYITVDVGIPLTCLVTKISKEELALEQGKQIWLQFKATSVHVI